MRLRLTTALGAALLLATAPVHALTISYYLNMDGAQQVPGPGDPDGSAAGVIKLDDATGLIEWAINYSNISAPVDMHIHGPGGSAGSAAGVFVPMGVATT